MGRAAQEGAKSRLHLVGGRERIVQVLCKVAGLGVAARVVVDERAQQALAQLPPQVAALRLLRSGTTVVWALPLGAPAQALFTLHRRWLRRGSHVSCMHAMLC